jgi:tripartite-type tricarboxylate transporter receptor subunit TctC
MAATSLSFTAAAQEIWPAHPLRLVVPYTAGGGTDIAARVIAERLAKRLGQPVVVDNRSGASGMLGTDAVAKARPDGYTFVLGTAVPLLTVKLLYKNPMYDPINDLSPVAFIGRSPLLIAVANKFAAKDLQQLIGLAKSSTEPLGFASTGYGVTAHLTMELLSMRTGAQFENIIYKGGSQAVVDVVAGNVMIIADGIGSLIGQVRDGSLRPIAVTGAARYPLFPAIPTVAEEIHDPGFEASTWYGVSAPRGTPKTIIDRISQEITQILADPEVIDRLRDTAGLQVDAGDSEAFAALISAEMTKWQAVIDYAKLEKQ